MRRGRQTVRQLALSAMIIPALVIGSTLSPRAATAATYYVATNGNNANAGTQAQPFQTIGQGLSVLAAGDTLYIRGGTYAERIDSNQQTVRAGTSWSNVVTIAAYAGETVTLRPGSGGEVINLTQSSIQYVVFDGLSLDATGVQFGMSLTNGANHVRFKNGEMKNSTLTGVAISVSPASSYNEILNSKIHDLGSSNQDHGLYIQTTNNLVEGCEIYNTSGYGIQLYNGYGGERASNNIIRNNRLHNLGLGSSGLGAVTINSGDDNMFYNNLVYDSLRGIDVMWGGPQRTKIYNNTIYNTSAAGIEIGSGSTNAVVQNNIVYQNGSTIINNGVGTQISNNLTTDPKFVNASAKDFTLQQTSPAIDTGVTLDAVTTDFAGTTRPQGAGYDVGAYEYKSGQVPTPTNLRVVLP